MKCSRCHRKARHQGLCPPHFNRTGSHGHVDAQPTRDRITLLRARGYGLRRLSAIAGISVPTLLCAHDTVQARTEKIIMAVPVPAEVTSGQGKVSAIGTRRRVQALVALGWTQRVIAERVGVTDRALSVAIRKSDENLSDLAAKTGNVYRELCMTLGPCNRSRIRARKLGFAPPLAWDDDSIDDPDAKPDMGEIVQVWFPEKWAELAELGITRDDHIAARLNITTESVKRMRERYGLKQAA